MDVLTQTHFAAQYLAAAGKSFLEHKADDSHTNIGFNTDTQSFETWELNKEGLKLIFNLPNFSLKWSGHKISLALDGERHESVVEWLQSSSQDMGLEKPYAFDLHYDLPFTWDNAFTFHLQHIGELDKIIRLRTLANEALELFLEKEGLASDIRIWPHHFDTGAFVVIQDGSDKSFGLGMAIPDTLVNDHYFYSSGYRGHDGLDTSNFSDLTKGTWKNNGFKGAVLAASHASKKEVVQFFEESYSAYFKT